MIAATAYGQIRLNRWNQPFYDALAHRDFHGFMVQLGVFGSSWACFWCLNVAQRWLAEMLKLKLREGLVQDLVGEWLKPHRAFRLAKVGPVGVNPDQRMHEDARHLTELSVAIWACSCCSPPSCWSLSSNVLWRISGSFVFHCHGRDLLHPRLHGVGGFLYAGSGSLLSYWVGRGLIRRNADRYQRESELRTSLNRSNEHIDEIEQAMARTRAADAASRWISRACWRRCAGW